MFLISNWGQLVCFLLIIIIFFFFPGKKQNDDLFDKLDTAKLNAHLKELMPGLTAKVFRTYNASITLDGMVSFQWSVGYCLVCWLAINFSLLSKI